MAVEAERNQEPAVAQQGFAALSQLKFGIRRVAGVEHHLLDVMRKTLDGGIGPEELARLRPNSPLVQGLHEVTGVRLVDRNVFKHRVIEVAEPLLAAGLAPINGG